MRELVPNRPYFIKLGQALTRSAGDDITLVAIGAMIPVALQASEDLARRGIAAEVIDLRCLMPLDLDTIIASVRRTGRLVVAEPGWHTYGAAAEIVAAVAEIGTISLEGRTAAGCLATRVCRHQHRTGRALLSNKL